MKDKTSAEIRKNSIFSPEGNWGPATACIMQYDATAHARISGFQTTADMVVRHILETNTGQDTCLYPICYLYRHAIELALKSIIGEGKKLFGVKESYPTHHKLKDLWEDAKPLIEKRWPDGDTSELNKIERIINELHQVDPYSMNFRYWETPGKRKLPRKPIHLPFDHIGILNLAESLSEVCSFLQGVSAGFEQSY